MVTTSTKADLTLFAGADELAATLLNISSVRHRSALLKLNDAPHHDFAASDFVAKLFEHFEGAWIHCREIATRLPSNQNWRWFNPIGEIAPHNRSPEVTLERAIIRAALAHKRQDWSNQIPIASGIGSGAGNRRRAVDLARYTETDGLELVELKIGSDTPLFAAIEILQYGFIWLLSRRDSHTLGYSDRTMLQASEVKLSVLAPSTYYRDFDLDWLATGLNDGVRALADKLVGVRMSFAFEEFPDEFRWPTDTEVDVMRALDLKNIRKGRRQPITDH